MSFLKKRFTVISEENIEKLKKEIGQLTELLAQYREKEKIEKFTNFITISVPRSKDAVDAFNEYLAGLGENEYFLFYLHSLETEIMEAFTNGKGMEAFTNGKGDDLYRGGLKVLKQIRNDTYKATTRKKDNAEQAV